MWYSKHFKWEKLEHFALLITHSIYILQWNESKSLQSRTELHYSIIIITTIMSCNDLHLH